MRSSIVCVTSDVPGMGAQYYSWQLEGRRSNKKLEIRLSFSSSALCLVAKRATTDLVFACDASCGNDSRLSSPKPVHALALTTGQDTQKLDCNKKQKRRLVFSFGRGSVLLFIT